MVICTHLFTISIIQDEKKCSQTLIAKTPHISHIYIHIHSLMWNDAKTFKFQNYRYSVVFAIKVSLQNKKYMYSTTISIFKIY